MFANVLIGLREGLEAALVVGILVAYLVKSERRDLLVPLWQGVGAAIAIAIGLGATLTFGPQTLTFEAQEAIGGTLSIIAVGLITWMIFWMAHTAKHLASSLRTKLDLAIVAGRWAVFLMAFLAVGREGLETALFLWAGARASGSTLEPLLGALLGLGTAIALGYFIYRGAIRLNLKTFFSWTGAFLVIVAAGVLSYGIHDLQEAGILPGLTSLAFDVSDTIPPASWYGTLLKGIFNFSPATTWLELIAWASFVTITMTSYVRIVWNPQVPAVRSTAKAL